MVEIEGYEKVNDSFNKAFEFIDNIRQGKLRPLLTSVQAENKKIRGFYPTDQIVIAGRSGMGKCLGINTPVLMYDGTIKKVQNISVNDELMGDDSTKRIVLSICRGKEQMYKIKQLNGDDYIVNESHILSLKKTGTGDVINISIKDYLNKSDKFKNTYKGYKTKIKFKNNNNVFEIDPYILGIWLGDGTSSKAEFTLSNDNIIKYVDNYFTKHRCKVNYIKEKSKNCVRLGISSSYDDSRFLLQLKKLNLLNNKHIPFKYLTSDENTRIQILSGLLDTDGYLTSNCYEIIQKSNQLSENIVFLARSLGFKVNISKTIKKIKSVNFEGEYNRITISGNIEKLNLLCEYKKGKSNPNKNHLVCGITIEKLNVDDYYGFELDGNKLFVLGDFTVTHNTSRMIHMMNDFLDEEINPHYKGKLIILYDSWEISSWRNALKLLGLKGNYTNQELLNYDEKMSDEIFNNLKEIGKQFNGKPLFIREFSDSIQKWVETKAKIAKKYPYPQYQIVNVVDHCRLITNENNSSEEKLLTDFMKAAMMVKKKFNMINFFLSQMNRTIENEAKSDLEVGKRLPMASHIFGSDKYCIKSKYMLIKR